MRIPFIKEKNIEDFEFSQAYLFFWDKIERSNYFLNTIADSYRRTPKEHVGGRLVSFLLGNPICDGGQWDMVVNLVEKHGKCCFYWQEIQAIVIYVINIFYKNIDVFCMRSFTVF